uniref:COR domain-containing protein n=1 Tax=Chryseobacterium endophyticum TaxID=1854762 RepID=A0AAU6WKB7_9FLAO
MSSNKISDINVLSKLKNLSWLSIYINNISSIEALRGNIRIKHLDLAVNKIKDLNPLKSLTFLEFLDISSNEITNIDVIHNFIKIKEIYLQNNSVNNLPAFNLPLLKKLYLYNNQISKINKLENKIEYHFHSDHRFNGILVGNNPLDASLIQILKSNRNIRVKALDDYFKNLELGSAPLLEAKLMILGEGEAGKTNLRNYIIDKSYEPGKSATTGIKIDTWKQIIKGLEYRINLWDFGGQWIQQQVHQFFLTNESVYIILLNARQDEKPEKWLDWIKNYTIDSKVFIVSNKMDENPNFSLEENLLRNEYPFIIDFHYISLLNVYNNKYGEKEKVDHLIERIKKEIINLKNVRALIPTNYHDLKKDLEDNFFSIEHSVSFDKFRTNLFEKHHIIGQPEVLLDILEKIGTIRFFKKFDKLILSPEWLSGGVYKILMSDIASKKNGVIDENDIKTIIVEDTLDQFNYREADIPFIQKLMMDFKLAYIKGDQHFIPSQFLTDLPKNLSLEDIENNFEFKFYFEFDTYFPDIFISKFIVDFFDKVDGSNFWKTGILLKDVDLQLNKETSAFVISKEKQRRLFIYLRGESIRNFFKEIYSNIKRFLEITGYRYQEIIELEGFP